VFGLGYLVWFFAGFFLLRIKTENWKINLALTWLAFILINGLPLQMFAGAFFYTGFGIAYTWLFRYFAIRITLAILAIGIMVWFRPFWISRFLQTAYSRSFLTDESHSKKFITYGVMFPWYFGILMLLPFGISGNSWIWIICLAGLGIVVLPIFNKQVPFEYIAYKSGKHIFTTKYPLPLVIAIVAVLWLLSWLTVRF
jgi:hypothetical protein